MPSHYLDFLIDEPKEVREDRATIDAGELDAIDDLAAVLSLEPPEDTIAEERAVGEKPLQQREREEAERRRMEELAVTGRAPNVAGLAQDPPDLHRSNAPGNAGIASNAPGNEYDRDRAMARALTETPEDPRPSMAGYLLERGLGRSAQARTSTEMLSAARDREVAAQVAGEEYAQSQFDVARATMEANRDIAEYGEDLAQERRVAQAKWDQKLEKIRRRADKEVEELNADVEAFRESGAGRMGGGMDALAAGLGGFLQVRLGLNSNIGLDAIKARVNSEIARQRELVNSQNTLIGRLQDYYGDEVKAAEQARRILLLEQADELERFSSLQSNKVVAAKAMEQANKIRAEYARDLKNTHEQIRLMQQQEALFAARMSSGGGSKKPSDVPVEEVVRYNVGGNVIPYYRARVDEKGKPAQGSQQALSNSKAYIDSILRTTQDVTRALNEGLKKDIFSRWDRFDDREVRMFRARMEDLAWKLLYERSGAQTNTQEFQRAFRIVTGLDEKGKPKFYSKEDYSWAVPFLVEFAITGLEELASDVQGQTTPVYGPGAGGVPYVHVSADGTKSINTDGVGVKAALVNMYDDKDQLRKYDTWQLADGSVFSSGRLNPYWVAKQKLVTLRTLATSAFPRRQGARDAAVSNRLSIPELEDTDVGDILGSFGAANTPAAVKGAMVRGGEALKERNVNDVASEVLKLAKEVPAGKEAVTEEEIANSVKLSQGWQHLVDFTEGAAGSLSDEQRKQLAKNLEKIGDANPRFGPESDRLRQLLGVPDTEILGKKLKDFKRKPGSAENLRKRGALWNLGKGLGVDDKLEEALRGLD